MCSQQSCRVRDPPVGRTSDASCNFARGVGVVRDEGAPQLAVQLAHGLRQHDVAPMVQEDQLGLLIPSATPKNAVPPACSATHVTGRW